MFCQICGKNIKKSFKASMNETPIKVCAKCYKNFHYLIIFKTKLYNSVNEILQELANIFLKITREKSKIERIKKELDIQE